MSDEPSDDRRGPPGSSAGRTLRRDRTAADPITGGTGPETDMINVATSTVRSFALNADLIERVEATPDTSSISSAARICGHRERRGDRRARCASPEPPSSRCPTSSTNARSARPICASSPASIRRNSSGGGRERKRRPRTRGTQGAGRGNWSSRSCRRALIALVVAKMTILEPPPAPAVVAAKARRTDTSSIQMRGGERHERAEAPAAERHTEIEHIHAADSRRQRPPRRVPPSTSIRRR